MSIFPARVAISSLLGGYGATQITGYNTLNVSGSVANGNTATFTCTVAADQSNSNYMWDVIAYNPANKSGADTENYTLLNSTVTYGNVSGLYNSVSGETSTFTSTWNSSTNQFVITLSIFNGTGAGITLTTQTIYCAGFFYLAPF